MLLCSIERFDLKLGRNTYAVATAIVAGGLFIAGLVTWRYSNIAAGWPPRLLVEDKSRGKNPQ